MASTLVAECKDNHKYISVSVSEKNIYYKVFVNLNRYLVIMRFKNVSKLLFLMANNRLIQGVYLYIKYSHMIIILY